MVSHCSSWPLWSAIHVSEPPEGKRIIRGLLSNGLVVQRRCLLRRSAELRSTLSLTFSTRSSRFCARGLDHVVLGQPENHASGSKSNLQLSRQWAVRGTASIAETDSKQEYADVQDFVKAGGSELDHVQMQAQKAMDSSSSISSQLPPLVANATEPLDLLVIGCGPAGLALAAEAAKQGLSVGLVGPDAAFVNNYGVWVDEFEALGLAHCLEAVWRDTMLCLGEGVEPVLVGRKYGRVSRERLWEELVGQCARAGVRYRNATVAEIREVADGGGSVATCADGAGLPARLVTVASGAAAGKFLEYEKGSLPGVGVQTAYGIEVELEGYPFDEDVMLFMDYREWAHEGTSLSEREDGLEKPTFLYAMPISRTRVFLEETCLASRPAMPFSTLKRRLEERIKRLGLRITKVYEEEWSYIPVGGALPDTRQQRLGFGASASMVHPATGYSIVRSLAEAPQYAAAIAASLRREAGSPSTSLATAALESWDWLWSREKKRQRAFMIFGLELILQMDLRSTREFFDTFFRLPEGLWRGFLCHSLTSVDLLGFAFMMFVVAPNGLRYRLLKHLVTDPSGGNLVRVYLGVEGSKSDGLVVAPPGSAAAFLLAMYSGLASQGVSDGK